MRDEVDPLKVIPSQKSETKQERARAYRRKRSTRTCLNSPPLKCGPHAVEPPSIISPSSSSTDCESDFTDNFSLTSSKEGGLWISMILLII